MTQYDNTQIKRIVSILEEQMSSASGKTFDKMERIRRDLKLWDGTGTLPHEKTLHEMNILGDVSAMGKEFMTNLPPRLLRVFLCHSSGDKPAVRLLYNKLISTGVDVWLDEEKLLPGQDWRLEILSAVRQSDVIIVCLSSNSVTKEGFVQKEIQFALDIAEEKPEGTIFIIPLRLDECNIPTRLNKWQYVDLFIKDGTIPHKGYVMLIKALRMRATQTGLLPTEIEIENEKLMQFTNWNEEIESELRTLRNKLLVSVIQDNLPATNEILGLVRSIKTQCEGNSELLAKATRLEEEVMHKRQTLRDRLGVMATAEGATDYQAAYKHAREFMEKGIDIVIDSNGNEISTTVFFRLTRRAYIQFLQGKASERLSEANGLLKSYPQYAITVLNEILSTLNDDILLKEDKILLEPHAQMIEQKIKEIETKIGDYPKSTG